MKSVISQIQTIQKLINELRAISSKESILNNVAELQDKLDEIIASDTIAQALVSDLSIDNIAINVNFKIVFDAKKIAELIKDSADSLIDKTAEQREKEIEKILIENFDDELDTAIIYKSKTLTHIVTTTFAKQPN